MARTDIAVERESTAVTSRASEAVGVGRWLGRTPAWSATPRGRVWLDALWIWALSRAVFIVIGLMVPALLLDHHSGLTFLDRWATQDGAYFVAIAQQGYIPLVRTAYWPLFPLLIRMVALVAGGSYQLAGLLIANAAFFGALVVLRALAERERGPEVARRACLYLAFFPTAFYFFAPYSEPLFLLVAIASFAAMRARRWWLAGALGFLATLTKSSGVLLLVPYAVELFQAWRHREARWWDAAWAVLIPAAAGVFSTYLWLNHDDPLAYAHSQAHWGRTVQPPWQAIAESFAGLAQSGAQGISGAHLALNLAAVLLFLGLAVLTLRTLPLSYGLFALAVCVYFLMFSIESPVVALQGDGRYVLMVFPAFMTLGLLGRRSRVHEALLVTMAPLLAILTAHFLLQLASG